MEHPILEYLQKFSITEDSSVESFLARFFDNLSSVINEDLGFDVFVELNDTKMTNLGIIIAGVRDLDYA